MSTRETEKTMLVRLNKKYNKIYRNGSYVGRRYSRAEHVNTSCGFTEYGDRIADFIAVDGFSVPWGELTEEERMNDPRRSASGAVIGHEIKVTRSDFLAELSDPEKSNAWGRYCTYWWLVAPPEVVKNDLPEGWGLMVPWGSSLRVRVKATRRIPELMPVRTVAALTRAIVKTETRNEREGMSQ